MPRNDDLQKELLRGLKQAFESKAAAGELQHQVTELKQQLHDAEKRMIEACAHTEAIEQRNTDLMSSLFSNGKENGGSARIAKTRAADDDAVPDHGNDNDYGSEDSSSTAAPKSKRRRTSDYHHSIPHISEAFPTILLIDGQWTEIWCDECGANAGFSHGFFKGMIGFQLHKRRFHQRNDSFDKIKAMCRRRIISDDDVERLRTNRPPTVKIPKILPPTTPKHQRGAELNVDEGPEHERTAGVPNRRSGPEPERNVINGDTASGTANDSIHDNDTDTHESSDFAPTGPLTSTKRRRPSDYHSNTPALSEAYPTIVRLDGKWTEIWCDECGANAGSTGQFGGMTGLHMHKRKSHAQSGPHVFEDVRLACRRRIVSSEDVKRIRKGDAPLVKIKRILPPNPVRNLADSGPSLDKEQENRQHSDDSDNDSLHNGNGSRSASSRRTTLEKPRKQPETRKTSKGLHRNYPTVVFLDDQWMEIWCRHCSANASRDRDFFSGMGGLHHHNSHCLLRKTPHTCTLQELVESCGRHAVNREDVARIREGQQPLVKIEKRFMHED